MSWIKTIFREVFGLFVDDGALALAILAWLVAAALAAPRLHVWAGAGLLLFAGLAAILVESVSRFARKAARNAGKNP